MSFTVDPENLSVKYLWAELYGHDLFLADCLLIEYKAFDFKLLSCSIVDDDDNELPACYVQVPAPISFYKVFVRIKAQPKRT